MHRFALRACHVARVFSCGLALSALLTACADDDRKHSADGDRMDDKSSNGLISIDETRLHAVAKDTSLDVTVPIHGLRHAAGQLFVSLRSVDGKKLLSTDDVAYEVESGANAKVVAHLTLPKDLQVQADRALYSVRVSDDAETPLHVTRSLLYALTPYELRLEGPGKLRGDKAGSYRVRMNNPITHAALADTAVSLVLSRGDKPVQSLSATTDADGSAIFELDAKDPGDYTVAAQTVESGTKLELVEAVSVEGPGRKLLTTTDKPIYQPGQLMHLRVLALETPNNTPVQHEDVTFEITDGKGNKVYKKAFETDDFGIASTTFRLASIVNMGTYKIGTRLGDASNEKTATVSRYALPKFDVTLGTDKAFYAPGATLHGTIDSRYFFGKSVGGAKVALDALTLDVGENVFQQVMGMTDANGHMAFSITLPSALVGLPIQDGNALVTLRATVTDTAGQEVKKENAITVAADAVRVTLVPEGTQIVPGIDNRLHLFATDPLGAPIGNADVRVQTAGADVMTAKTDPYGHVELGFVAQSESLAFDVTVTTSDGTVVNKHFDFQVQTGNAHVLVRTDKSIYELGDTAKVQVLVSKDEKRVYVDWLNEGQAVDMRTLEATDGVATLSMPLDATLSGENRVEAYVVDADGSVVRAGRTIIVNREGALSVSMTSDKSEYRPGAAAKLTFTVKDEQGKPKAAALGVQIVDDAVFSLIDARPGLLRTYFELEDSFAKPTYELEAPAVSFEQLLFEAPENDAEAKNKQVRAEASLAALQGNHMMGLMAGSWPDTLAAVQKLLAPKVDAEKKLLIAALAPKVKAEAKALIDSGCKPEDYYCSGLSMSFGQALSTRVSNSVDFSDFWGSAYTDAGTYDGFSFTSRGPDELAMDADDIVIAISWNDFDLDVWHGTGVSDAGVGAGFFPPQAAEGDNAGNFGAAGTGGGFDDGSGNAHGSKDADGTDQNPRVRKDFPETLYVNPALITDGDGKATISLDMADSITKWRVSALASAADGKLGGGQAGVTVFQDFFVDVNFPAELTRGDEVEFPVVLYNYLQKPQTVAITVDSAPWFTALGSVSSSVTLAAGEVKSVQIPVRVEQVGTQTLTVHALGDTASDAVARTVRVIADGLAMPLAQSGSLAAGDKSLSATFPANAVPGSGQLYLDVFPAFLAQAVQGLDSLLQTPSGCFEQTTSTTWPNVLVERYMEQTKQITPELQLKAESLVSAGYQRLLTFEHTGGGFSWFGEQDPAPFLSVTAFGLMEFADMAKVQEVDDAMRARTRAWLVAQQKADGSWPGDQSEFFTFQTSAVRNTAFVIWALAQDGDTGPELQRGLDYVKQNLKSDDDAYTVALAANAFASAAPDDAETSTLLERLDASKVVSGGKASWDAGDTQTNFYASGNDAVVSATALATHAMITAGGYAGTVKQALDFITASKDAGGNFGSTQATVWSLKTLLMAALHGTAGAVGTLDVQLDGQPFASVALTKDQADVMTRVDMTTLATAGAHSVALTFAGTGKVSYNLVSSYNIPWSQAPVQASGSLSVAISYDRSSLAVNELVNATLSVDNLTAQTQNMVLVTAGIPPGFELLGEDLDAYVGAGTLSRHEQTGKQVILYLTSIDASAKQTFKYRLRATMPVTAADGGATVYPYYEPEKKTASASQNLVATN